MVNTITKGIHKVIQEKGCCNMKKNTIICISREFGSGGREVGQQLSKKLGIPFYDKEILARVAEESDMSEEFVKNHEENAVYSHIINVPIGHRFPGVDTEEIMTPEKLFMIQAHVIHELAAENESCIFVGRCADVVLKYPQSSRRTDQTDRRDRTCDRTTSEEDDQANRLGEIFLS